MENSYPKNNNYRYFELLSDISPNFFVINDATKLTFANKTMLKFFGFDTINSFLQKHNCISDFFVPYNDNAITKTVDKNSWFDYALNNPGAKNAYFLKDGNICIYEIFVSKSKLEGKSIYVCVFNDITEIGKQKQRFSQAIDGSQVGLWDWDLAKNSIHMSPYYKEMLGYEDDELKNEFKTWLDRVHPDDLASTIKDIEENQKGLTPFYRNIHRLKHKDGHWVWIEDRGKTYFDENKKPIKMIGTHTDISKEKESELNNILYQKKGDVLLKLPRLSEELDEYNFIKTAQKLLEELTQSQTSFIHYINEDDMSIEFASSDKLYDKNRLNNDKLSITKERAFIRLIEERKALIFNEYEILPYNEDILEEYKNTKRLICVPVIEDKKIVMICGVGNKKNEYVDLEAESVQLVANEIWRLIQRRRNLLELQEQQKLLVIQSRYAAMGEMISMIAHQWRQPIGIIEMCANNIFLDMELGELNIDETKKHLEEVTKQTKYLSTTIDDFRNFFNPTKIKSKVLIEKIVKNALTLLEKNFQKHKIKINFIEKTTTNIKVLEKELLQVFINILNNAKDALVSKNIKNPTIDLYINEYDEYIQINICDNAGGIDPQIIDKVFEPYFSTKNQKEGTGLGLYISKIIVEKHILGKISVSNVHEGACFKIEILKS